MLYTRCEKLWRFEQQENTIKSCFVHYITAEYSNFSLVQYVSETVWSLNRILIFHKTQYHRHYGSSRAHVCVELRKLLIRYTADSVKIKQQLYLDNIGKVYTYMF